MIRPVGECDSEVSALSGTTGRVAAIAASGASRSWMRLRAGQGVEGDETPRPGLRQVCLLAVEGLSADGRIAGLDPGHCGEHVRFEGLRTDDLHVGDFLKVGKAVLLVTKKGKACAGTDRCTGSPEDCPVAGNWVYARVMGGGQVCLDDEVHAAVYARDLLPAHAR
jgi:MOSC domain-containing protein YiiM